MKLLYPVLLLIVILSSCVSSRYELNDKGADKKFLTQYIRAQSKTGIISRKPLVVVDGLPLRYDVELKRGSLRQYSKEDIFRINSVDRKGSAMIWGPRYGKGGAVIINIRRHPNRRGEKRNKEFFTNKATDKKGSISVESASIS